jgi:hypothetical protein
MTSRILDYSLPLRYSDQRVKEVSTCLKFTKNAQLYPVNLIYVSRIQLLKI